MTNETQTPEQQVIQAAYNANQEAWQNAYTKGVVTTASIAERPAMNRQDYEIKRDNEAIVRGRTQSDLRKIMEECIRVYNSVGIIKNVIDMIADFAVDGVELVHPDERTNIFYQRWSEKVKLRDRAKQFAKWYLKAGNTVVRREMATIDRKNLVKMLEMDENDPKALTAEAGKIPIRYWFYNPTSVEVVGDYLSCYSDTKEYALRVSQNVLSNTSTGKSPLETKVFSSLPKEIQDLFKKKTGNSTVYIPIPKDLVYVDSYTKDDSEIWARPITYGVLQDVYYNEKIKLAKTASLDGMISPIRSFKLGDHKEKLWPAPNSGQLLQSLLKNNTAGGPIDIIWTSDLEIETFYPPVDALSNYNEDYDAILIGLGVPKILVAPAKEASASGNISLKGMIVKIESVRDAINKWLQTEIAIIHNAMKFRRRPSIRYRYANVSDERTFFDILLEMADRNIISHQRVLELFRDSYEIEHPRLAKEEANTQYEKLSPLRREPKVDSGKAGQEFNGGRPPGAKDSKPRTRTKKDPMSAEMIVKVGNRYSEIFDYALKFGLAQYKKSDIRQLTNAEKQSVESMADKIFVNMDLDTTLNDSVALEALSCSGHYTDFLTAYAEILKESGGSTVKHRRTSKVLAYGDIWGIT